MLILVYDPILLIADAWFKASMLQLPQTAEPAAPACCVGLFKRNSH